MPVFIKQMLLDNVVALQIKARPYVLDTKYEKAFETDIHLRVIEAFNERAILPPAILFREREGARLSRAKAS